MAFKLKHTNVQNMLGTGPKMYKEEGPAMYADKESAGPKAMMPDFPDVDNDGNTTESIKSATQSQGAKSISAPQNARPSRKGVPPHVQKQNSKGAKSMGPKRKGEPGVTDKDGKVIFTKEQREERKTNIVSPAEQKAIAAKNAARKASIKDRQ